MNESIPSGAEGLKAAAATVRERGSAAPQVGVVLGSGLGSWAAQLEGALALPYDEIPGLAPPSVAGHGGTLWLGRRGAAQVACLQGRVHAYEGHAPARVVFGVRLLAALGCRAVLLTNAAGGIRTDLAPGDLMLLTDHLNLTGLNPIVGWPVTGSPFVDMTQAYDAGLGQLAQSAASQLQVDLKRGVYAGLLGPSYETPAEVRMLRGLGADAVGMSTVLECIALRQLGVRVGAVSCITNAAAGLDESPLDHEDVQAQAALAKPRFERLLSAWVEAAAQLSP